MNITIYSGIKYLGSSLEQDLELADISLEPIKFIIVDRPVGWAFLAQHAPKLSKALILSDNPCPEYRLRLLERDPIGLVEEISLKAVLDAAEAVKFNALTPPETKTRLTPSERTCLHLAADGKTNKEIAVVRDVTEGVVKNSLNSINYKLGLKSRIQLAHYYYGNWHLLKNWQPTEPSPFYAHLLRAQQPDEALPKAPTVQRRYLSR